MTGRIAARLNLIDQQDRRPAPLGCTAEIPADEIDRRIRAEQERIAREAPEVMAERSKWRKPRDGGER